MKEREKYLLFYYMTIKTEKNGLYAILEMQ